MKVCSIFEAHFNKKPSRIDFKFLGHTIENLMDGRFLVQQYILLYWNDMFGNKELEGGRAGRGGAMGDLARKEEREKKERGEAHDRLAFHSMLCNSGTQPAKFRTLYN